jgi:XisI protein
MVNIKRCQKAILSILEDYATVRYSNINAENKLIADKVNHRYQVVTIGWDKTKFVHDCPMHIDIIDGKVWIQRNKTEIDIAAILTEQGIAKSDIVLGFLTPKMREYSDYALA